MLLAIALSVVAIGQRSLSDKAEISLYTCGVGDDLYTLFGHTAIRVEDPLLGIDKVYNYGTFSFTDDFVFVFAMGRLMYSLSAYPFEYFEPEYRANKRFIKKQTLNLNPEEKDRLYKALEINNLPQNRDYLYDFFYDNCSTRPRIMIEGAVMTPITYPDLTEGNPKTMRELIEDYLGGSPWTDFGIDLGLGSYNDTLATNTTYMFLPYEMYRGFETAQKGDEPLVSKSENIYVPEERASSWSITDPIPLAWILFLVMGFVSFRDMKRNRLTNWMDMTFFSVVGLLGWLVFFLWFITDHQATKANLNILWAFPLYFPLAFFAFGNKTQRWSRIYLLFSALLTMVVLLLFPFPIQEFHWATLPLLLIILIRLALRLYLIKKLA